MTRLAGPDRFATGVALAEAAVDAGASAAEVLVASGVSFPDALAAGPAAAALGGVLLLTDPHGLPTAVADWLTHHGPAVQRIRVVGGAGAVADQVLSGLVLDHGRRQRLTPSSPSRGFWRNRTELVDSARNPLRRCRAPRDGSAQGGGVTVRTSPVRRVRPAASRCSSSGSAYLRVVPRISRARLAVSGPSAR